MQAKLLAKPGPRLVPAPETHAAQAVPSRLHVAMLVVLVGLAGCAAERPDRVVSPRLDSGVTSNNGGGQRALGDTLDEGVAVRETRP